MLRWFIYIRFYVYFGELVIIVRKEDGIMLIGKGLVGFDFVLLIWVLILFKF